MLNLKFIVKIRRRNLFGELQTDKQYTIYNQQGVFR